ncbi:MAG TPA: MFS transporter [Verrucomicrobiae bacterium]|nr:MFS transporter [Verrucomicrobiae bacterium]
MTPVQWRTFIACFLGWTLDAFDFFLVIVVLPDLSKAFAAPVPRIAVAVTLTLAMRPLGALLFGYLADRFGRKRPLMVDVALYSFLELLTAFSPNLTFFLIVRILFGVAMGGEWGLGAALAMESLPPKRRGVLSGVLQEGYAVGNLLAGVCLTLFFGLFEHSFPGNGWRGMFVIGTVPALLVLFIRSSVPESPAWEAGAAQRLAAGRDVLLEALRRGWPLFLYGMFFMACFNFMSHGTQDPYVTFVSVQRGFSHAAAGNLNSIAAIGAILGGIVFGALSQRFGRRWMIIAAAVLGLIFIKIWTGGTTFGSLALGGFLMQFAVQGAWGIIPAYLNEMSPELARGTFPGFVYQLGNLIASGTLQIITTLAATTYVMSNGMPDYAAAMDVFMYVVFAAVIVFTAIGFAVTPERREASFVPNTTSG